MPSPFPGMDPYLESPDYWRDVHSSFLVEVRVALNATLPLGFVARTEERLYVVEPDRSIYPDIALTRQIPERPTGVVGAAVIDKPIIYFAPPEEVRESFVEIRSVKQGGQVVTVIELLSLANKMSGRGREEYRRKQYDLLRSDVHFLEIDLLRAGEHTIALPKLSEPGKEYLACLHRGDGSWRFVTWAFGLRDRLPRVAVPLTEELPDIALDLQEVFTAVYDGGRYGETIDYRQSPLPPLHSEDRDWAKAFLP
ncbi:DUF4058 family protein [Armatimonas sp.]|uniref:DUF4058 family protein n=1 Tax=Armatimonas sp. TaxID=1872638 RepID=UPI0037517CB3